jgi:N-sulfoglucosamine sulfohydrolase
MPALLKAAGYRTCNIGKLHVGPPEVFPFDTFANEGIEQRNTVRMAENAEKWLREDGDKPFFLYFCPIDPHRSQKNFGNEREYPGVRETKVDPAKVPIPSFLPDRPEVREDLAEYYQSVARMDQGVGRLLETLKATNHLDDTLIIYLSDNGIPFPNAKTNLYDPGIRLPLIVRRPGGKAHGVVSQAMVSWTDVLPTVLDWANVKAPSYGLQGRSFLKVLDEERPDGWDEVYASHQFHEITMYYPMRMLRTRTHKLILNIAWPLEFPAAQDLFDSPTWQGMLQRKDPMVGPRAMQAYLHRPQYELYDLEKDPDELRNLANSPDEAGRLKKMQAQLRDWQEKTGDPWALKYLHE